MLFTSFKLKIVSKMIKFEFLTSRIKMLYFVNNAGYEDGDIADNSKYLHVC